MNHTDGISDLIDRGRRRALPEPAMRRYLRTRAGLTQHDVAQTLGVSRVTVTRWERGTRTPRGALREAYAALLTELTRAAA